MPPRTLSLDLTQTCNYVCKSCLTSLRPVHTISPVWLAARQFSSFRKKKPKRPEKSTDSEKGVEFPDPAHLQRMLAEDLENATPNDPSKSFKINYFTQSKPGELQPLPDNDAFSEDSGGLDTEVMSAITDLERKMVYTLKMLRDLEKQGKREKAEELRRQFKQTLRAQYKGKLLPNDKKYSVLRIPGFSGYRHRAIVNLNTFLERHNVAEGGTPSARDVVGCWKYYSAARMSLSSDWKNVHQRVWDFLWMILSAENTENPNRMHHIYILAKDMRAAGVVLSDSQQLLAIEAMFIEGWKAEAIEAWKKAVVTLGSKKETFKPYYELGVRMLSLHGEGDRAQRAAHTLLKSSHKSNPRILLPVIRALAAKESTQEEAWNTFQDMQTLLGDTITIEDYDEIIHSFLLVNAVEYALQAFVDMMFSKAIDIRGKTRLPSTVGNAFFMGKWLKRLIGAGDLDGAYKVVVYLQGRGIVASSIQLNGLLGAWLRSGTAENVEKAEKLAWSMIEARLDHVRLRQQEAPSQVPATKIVERSTEGLEFKVLAKATAETFSLLAENYCSRRLHSQLVELFKVLQEAKITATGYIMNMLIRSYSQDGNAKEAIKIYHKMTQEQAIKPDGHTFLTLFNLLSVNRLVTRNPNLYVEDRKAGRQFFLDMVRAKWKVDSAELLAQLPRTIVFSLLKTKDYTGAIVAARTMRHLVGFHPTEPFLVELISGINTLNVKTKRNFTRLTDGSRKVEGLMREYRMGLISKGHPGDEMTVEEKMEEAHAIMEQVILLKAGALEVKPYEVEAELEAVARDMGVYDIAIEKDPEQIARYSKLGPAWN